MGLGKVLLNTLCISYGHIHGRVLVKALYLKISLDLGGYIISKPRFTNSRDLPIAAVFNCSDVQKKIIYSFINFSTSDLVPSA